MPWESQNFLLKICPCSARRSAQDPLGALPAWRGEGEGWKAEGI